MRNKLWRRVCFCGRRLTPLALGRRFVNPSSLPPPPVFMCPCALVCLRLFDLHPGTALTKLNVEHSDVQFYVGAIDEVIEVRTGWAARRRVSGVNLHSSP